MRRCLCGGGCSGGYGDDGLGSWPGARTEADGPQLTPFCAGQPARLLTTRCPVLTHFRSPHPSPLQRQRQENDRLRAEMAKLRAMLEAAATVGPAAAAAAVAAAPHLPSAVGVSDGLAQPGRPLQNGWTQARASPLAPTLTNGNGGAFRPTATTRQLAPATLAELPLPAGAQPQQQAQVLSIPAKQVQAALNLYYQDLQVFAASVQLERVPLDGE